MLSPSDFLFLWRIYLLFYNIVISLRSNISSFKEIVLYIFAAFFVYIEYIQIFFAQLKSLLVGKSCFKLIFLAADRPAVVRTLTLAQRKFQFSMWMYLCALNTDIRSRYIWIFNMYQGSKLEKWFLKHSGTQKHKSKTIGAL